MFNELEVKRLNNKYKFKECKVFEDVVYVSSIYDNWIVEYRGNKIRLKHQNRKDHKTRTHVQRYFGNVREVFKSI